MDKYLSIGTIGWRNHAGDVIDAVNMTDDARVRRIYHPSYVPEWAGTTMYGTSNFDDLLVMDGVMILSPNDTHMYYLEKLIYAGYKGYIFCEKPPVTNVLELKRLRELNPSRVMYDFSLRYSYLASRLKDMLQRVGKVITADVWVTHGLAFKPNYKGSWRADKTRHEHGVLETVSVHWIDLLLTLLGPPVGTNHFQRNVAETGTSADTSIARIRHADGAHSTIVSSYAAPALTRLSIIGSEGMIEYDEGILALRLPRDTFDEAGKFKRPTVVLSDSIPDPFVDGMRTAVNTFVSAIRRGDEFPREWVKHSIETMDVIVECKGLIL